jgi:hypothetical protein
MRHKTASQEATCSTSNRRSAKRKPARRRCFACGRCFACSPGLPMPSRRSFASASRPPLTACRLRFALQGFACRQARLEGTGNPSRSEELRNTLPPRSRTTASQEATRSTSNRRLPSENRHDAGVSREDVSDAQHQRAEARQAKTGTTPVFRVKTVFRVQPRVRISLPPYPAWRPGRRRVRPRGWRPAGRTRGRA